MLELFYTLFYIVVFGGVAAALVWLYKTRDTAAPDGEGDASEPSGKGGGEAGGGGP